jgi:hypothetical protein
MKTSENMLSRTVKIASLIAVILFATNAWAQNENDTTRIKMGKKKILIVESNNISELRTGILEFKQQITELQDSITKLKGKEAINDEAKVAQEKQIAELEKQIASIEKGITETEKQIAEMRENKHSGHHSNNDFNFNWKRKSKKFNGHFAGFEMGLNNLVNSSQKMEMPADGKFMELNSAKSWAFAINFLEYNIPLKSSYVGLTTGMGIEWNGYYLDKKYKIMENVNGVIYGEETPEQDYSKNKLNTTHINVPLILEFQIPVSSKDGRIHLGFGVVGGVRTGSNTKQHYKISGKKYEDKTRDDYQLSPFRYSYTFRVGYGALNLFANYSPIPLFKKNHGPELYPFSVGVSFPFDNY